MGRCFFGAFHGPGDKANDQVAVVNWNPGIRMTPSRECCSAQRYAPDTDTPGQQHSDAGRMVWGAIAYCATNRPRRWRTQVLHDHYNGRDGPQRDRYFASSSRNVSRVGTGCPTPSFLSLSLSSFIASVLRSRTTASGAPDANLASLSLANKLCITTAIGRCRLHANQGWAQWKERAIPRPDLWPARSSDCAGRWLVWLDYLH
jgi:hypothetical protein